MANPTRKTAALVTAGVLLLLASLGTTSAHAQIEPLAPTVPLSPGLAPSLTSDPATAPVTTLAIDLLAPQRPFTFDPSGAAISSNALNPEIYSSSLNSSRAETDTQLRDASQTGQLSPYSTAARRLGLTLSADSGSVAAQESSSPRLRAAQFGDLGSAQRSDDADASASSWGGGSSFATRQSSPQSSSWSTRRLVFDRSGNQPASLAATEAPPGETAASGIGNGYPSARNNPESSVSSLRTASVGSLNPRPSRIGASLNGARNGARNASMIGAIGSRDQAQAIDSEPGSRLSPEPSANRSPESPPQLAISGGLAATGNPALGTSVRSGDHPGTAPNSLTFFPQAAYVQSPLGQSPFSSPGGSGELHFLNPDIYAATRPGSAYALSSSRGANRRPGGNMASQSLAKRDALPNSASHYGLATHAGMEGSAGSLKSNRKSSRPNNGLLDSPN